jgi:hypothetical protein
MDENDLLLKEMQDALLLEEMQDALAQQEVPEAIESKPWWLGDPYTRKDPALSLLAGGIRGVGELLDAPITLTKALGLADEETLPDFYSTAAKKLNKLLLGEKLDPRFEEVGSYLTPVGSEKLGLQLLSGLGAYGGTKLAEYFAPDSTIAALGAPLVGAFTPSGLGLLSKKGSILASKLPVISREKRAMQEILAQMTPEEIARLQEAQTAGTIVETVPVPKTLAEVVQSPEVAAYQDIMQGRPGVADITTSLTERRRALEQRLSDIAPTAPQGRLAQEVEAAVAAEKAQKAAIEGKLLDDIDEISINDPLAAGTEIQESLVKRKAEAKATVDEKWAAVPKELELDVTDEIDDIFNWYNSLDDVAKEDAPGINKAINRLRRTADDVEVPEYRLTYERFQNIRAGLNKVIVGAEGTNEARLAKELKTKMDEMLGRLDPREEALKDVGYSTDDVKALYEAIDAYRDYGQTFRKGVVGEVTKQRLGDLKVKASTVVNRMLKYPENVIEIVGKFGRKADEMVVLRQQLLKRLNELTPGKVEAYIKKQPDVFREVFDADYSTVLDYAKKRDQKIKLSQFDTNKLADSTVSNAMLRTPEAARKFAETFADTEILTLGKGKLMEKLQTRGSVAANVEKYDAVGKELFKDDWPIVRETALALDKTKGVDALKGQKIKGAKTEPAGAQYKRIQQSRLRYRIADKAGTLGGLLGLVADPQATFRMRMVKAFFGRQIGEMTQAQALKFEQRYEQAIGRLLADPRLIRIAKEPETPASVAKLEKALIALMAAKPAALGAEKYLERTKKEE